MASTFSTDLKLELMATGENAGTWGTKTNTNLNLIQQAIAGFQSIDVASADVTLVMTDASISNARNMVLQFTGTLTADRTVNLPDSIEKFYVVVDATTHGAFTLTFKTVSGTGFLCVQGKSHFAYSDGTNLNLISGIEIANITLDSVLNNGDTSNGTINISNIVVSAATATDTLSASGAITGSSTLAIVSNITSSAGNITSSAGTVSDSKGEVRLLPLVAATSRTLLASDHGKVISATGTITVPPSVFSAGQTITIYNNSGSNISISRGSGVVLYWAQTGADANRTLAQRGVATILCVASNTFVITGGTLT
jgi:hypothetical protein